jgi:hypothetical protein
MEPATRRRFGASLLLVLTAITCYSYLRGQRADPEWAGIVYYVVDYSDGLIRRGLIGQLFMLVFSRTRASEAFAAAVEAHRLICFMIMAGTLVWFWSLMSSCRRFGPQRLTLIYLVYLSSQFLPTLAAINTYLDAYALLLLLVAYVSVASRHNYLAAAAGFVAPFIHEFSVILWLSLIIMMLWRDGLSELRKLRVLIIGAAPFAGYAALSLFESHTAVATQLNQAPISDAIRHVMAREQFGHEFFAELSNMAALIAANPGRGAVSIFAFSAPTALMLALAAPCLDRRGRWLLGVASFTPLITLLLAFDLSRFVVCEQFVCMLSVLFMAASPPAVPTGRPVSSTGVLLLGPVLIAGLLMPLVYGYFDSTQIVTNEVLDSVPVLGHQLRRFYAIF